MIVPEGRFFIAEPVALVAATGGTLPDSAVPQHLVIVRANPPELTAYTYMHIQPAHQLWLTYMYGHSSMPVGLMISVVSIQ